MASTENTGAKQVRFLPVTVYYDREPKLVKQKYEMDKFFFEYGDEAEKELLPDKFTLLVQRYRRAVFDAACVLDGKSAEKAEDKVKFEETA